MTFVSPAPVTHVLLIEDDREIAALVSRYLRAHGLRVTTAIDAHEMNRHLIDSRVDILVLDVMLPGEDGLSICRKLRNSSNIPIIIVSARGDEADRVVGLELGADDYLPKPFGPRELLARIRAIMRRSQSQVDTGQSRRSKSYRFLGWSVEPVKRSLINPDGDHVTLTGAEFELLCVFCERPGRILSREQLLELTQGRAPGPFERSVDILVSRLRRKLSGFGDSARFIQTIRSGGYLFSPDVEVS